MIRTKLGVDPFDNDESSKYRSISAPTFISNTRSSAIMKTILHGMSDKYSPILPSGTDGLIILRLRRLRPHNLEHQCRADLGHFVVEVVIGSFSNLYP